LDTLEAGIDMQFAVVNLPLFAAAADRLGLVDELAAALAARPATRWTDVVRKYAAGDFVEAADILRRIGSEPDEAAAPPPAGRCGRARSCLFPSRRRRVLRERGRGGARGLDGRLGGSAGARRHAQRVGLVRLLPGEVVVVAAEVSVRRRLRVDRAREIEVLD